MRGVQKNIIKKKVKGSIDKEPVAIVHPITGGKAPLLHLLQYFVEFFFLTKLYKQIHKTGLSEAIFLLRSGL